MERDLWQLGEIGQCGSSYRVCFDFIFFLIKYKILMPLQTQLLLHPESTVGNKAHYNKSKQSICIIVILTKINR